MIRAIAVSVVVASLFGCASSSQTFTLIRPTLQEAEAGIANLKRGMTREEAIRALAFPEHTQHMWLIAGLFASAHYTLLLGPEQPSEHSLLMTFVFSSDDKLMHLDDWKIHKNEWKMASTEQPPAGDRVSASPEE